MFIGTSHDTADFAVDNVVRWWNYRGKRCYPATSELLILADSGAATAREPAPGNSACRNDCATATGSP